MMNTMKTQLLRKCTDLVLANEDLRAQQSDVQKQLAHETKLRKRFQHQAACLDAENEDLLQRCAAKSRRRIQLPADFDPIVEDAKDASAKWSLIDQKEAELKRVLRLIAIQDAEKKIAEAEMNALQDEVESQKERALVAEVRLPCMSHVPPSCST